MDKELFRKTEKSLYEYFKDKKRLESKREEIKKVEEFINIIDKKIKNYDFHIDPYQGGSGNEERVQTSSSTSSYVENELIKAIDNLEREKVQWERERRKLESEERDLIYKTFKLENNIGLLNDECKKLIELKYKDGLDNDIVAYKMNMARSTFFEFRKDLIENIANYRW